MTKRTALVSSTPKLIDQEAWVKEQPKPSPDEKTTRLVVELPADLHRQLKGHCGLTGLKIKDVIQQLLEQYLAGIQKNA